METGGRNLRRCRREGIAAAAGWILLLGSGCPGHLRPATTNEWGGFDEEEGRSQIELALLEADREMRETTVGDADPCAPPELSARMRRDGNLLLEGSPSRPALDVRIDVFLPALEVPADGVCPARTLPFIGFEWWTEEAGDDEEHSGEAAGFTDAEERALGVLREEGTGVVSVLRPEDFPYRVYFADTANDDGFSPPEMDEREQGERRLRESVRAILEDLRRNGFL